MKYAIYNQNGVLELREDSQKVLPSGAKIRTVEFDAVATEFPPSKTDAEIRALFEALP